MSTPTPIPSVPPIGVTAAAGLTAISINKYAGSDTSKKLAAAMTAQAVAGVLTTAATGNVAGALSQLRSLFNAITDPGLLAFSQDLWAIGTTFLQGEADVLQTIPVLSDEIDGWMTNAATGINQVAAADIAAYSTTKKA